MQSLQQQQGEQGSSSRGGDDGTKSAPDHEDYSQEPPEETFSASAAAAPAPAREPTPPPVQHSVGGVSTGNIYIPPKDEGKMFVGGLNWETTEDSMRNYFSKFGEVLDVSVMRDNNTGRSRGFGFLTFRDSEAVNRVLQSEHYLDGKIIDPKRAIPREEQDKTAKIFVGGVGADVTENDFKNFFDQYGTVIDAQLMIDKDTGRPRGFGFVTFDSDRAVERIVTEKFLILKGKSIEVKRAEPRGRAAQEAQTKREPGYGSYGQSGMNPYMNGMDPAMMSQYLQQWRAYMAQMQQMMAQGGGQGGQQQMNPAMMQQMMQQYQQYGQQFGAGAEGQQGQQGGYYGGGYGQSQSPGAESGEREGSYGGGNDDEGDNGNNYRERGYRGGGRHWDRRDSDDRQDRSRDRSAGRRSRSPPGFPQGPQGGRGGRNGRERGGRGRHNGGGYHPYSRN